MSVKGQLQEDLKTAMKAGEKDRLKVLRLISAAIKQVEVDERIELDDTRIIATLDKMAKQRRESITQFESAGREDLLAIERDELEIIQEFLPAALSDDEIESLVDASIASTGAAGMLDMGKLMGALKPQLQGRADIGKVSQLVKARLSA